MRIDYAIVFVADMTKSVTFYRDTLGLPLRFESTHWSEFATEGATLALHKAEAGGTADDPRYMPPARCRTGFCVPDLAAFHQRMQAHGVTCVQEPKNVFGAMIATYLDPDGLSFGVSQERSPR